MKPVIAVVAAVAVLGFQSAAAQDSPAGRWVAADGKSVVEIGSCPDAAGQLCGVVVEERAAPGEPRLLGTVVLRELRPARRGWKARYTPGSDEYAASVRFPAADRAEFRVCVLFVCETEHYNRVPADFRLP